MGATPNTSRTAENSLAPPRSHPGLRLVTATSTYPSVCWSFEPPSTAIPTVHPALTRTIYRVACVNSALWMYTLPNQYCPKIEKPKMLDSGCLLLLSETKRHYQSRSAQPAIGHLSVTLSLAWFYTGCSLPGAWPYPYCANKSNALYVSGNC